jgi:hypothetical protein
MSIIDISRTHELALSYIPQKNNSENSVSQAQQLRNKNARALCLPLLHHTRDNTVIHRSRLESLKLLWQEYTQVEAGKILGVGPSTITLEIRKGALGR